MEVRPCFVKAEIIVGFLPTLVEVNDGFSLGSYGLWHDLYARLLSARWAELVGVSDPCDFGLEIPSM